MMGLSTRQIELLMIIVRSPRPLVYGELMEAAGVTSKATIHYHLAALRRAGLVTWAPKLKGTLRATVCEVPLVTQSK